MGIEAHSTRPEKPFAPARAAFEDLVAAVSSAEALSLTHSALEQLVQERGLEVLRQLLQGHMDWRGPGEAAAPVRTRAGVVLTHERWDRGRHWESIFGTIRLTRVGYGAKAEAMAYPLDADLNLPPDRYSLGVRRRVATEAVRGSFDDAVTAVQATTGAHVPKRQAEELTVRAAADFETFYEQQAEVADAEATSPVLVVSVDGKGVAMRAADRRAAPQVAPPLPPGRPGPPARRAKTGAKRMATVATVYTVAPYVRTPEQVVAQILDHVRAVPGARPRPEGKRVWASLERPPADVIGEAFEEAVRRDPQRQKAWVAVVDGNETQLRLLEGYADAHGVDVTIILDLMHVLSYLWNAAQACHPGDDEATAHWVRVRLLAILQGRAGFVAGGMRRRATRRGLSAVARRPIDRCATYLLNHTAYLTYPEYLAQGWPICSGVIEGTCRHLINDRMDRTGARWRLRGAEAVLRLRSLAASGDFDDYWRFHEAQERGRNHASRYAAGLPLLRKPHDKMTRRSHLHLVE